MPSISGPQKMFESSSRLQQDDAGEVPFIALHHCSAVPWQPRAVAAIGACPDGTAVAVARDDGSIEIWDPRFWTLLLVRKYSSLSGNFE
jgi:hypothetical protein